MEGQKYQVCACEDHPMGKYRENRANINGKLQLHLCFHFGYDSYVLPKLSPYLVMVYVICLTLFPLFLMSLSDRSRKTIFIGLLVTSVLGTLSFLALRKTLPTEEEMLNEEEGQPLLSSRMMLVS